MYLFRRLRLRSGGFRDAPLRLGKRRKKIPFTFPTYLAGAASLVTGGSDNVVVCLFLASYFESMIQFFFLPYKTSSLASGHSPFVAQPFVGRVGLNGFKAFCKPALVVPGKRSGW